MGQLFYFFVQGDVVFVGVWAKNMAIIMEDWVFDIIEMSGICIFLMFQFFCRISDFVMFFCFVCILVLSSQVLFGGQVYDMFVWFYIENVFWKFNFVIGLLILDV